MSEQRDAAKGAVEASEDIESGHDADAVEPVDVEAAEPEDIDAGANGQAGSDGESEPDRESELDGASEPDGESAGGEPSRAGAHRARGPALAAVTALVVLVASAAGYYTTVPKTVSEPSRMAQLVVTHTGLSAFSSKPKAKQQVKPSQSGITAIKDAAKASPDETGGYLVGWEPSSSKVAVVVAFVLPTEAQAATALSQLQKQGLATDAEKASSLVRKARFALRGIPGSAGALFGPKSGKDSSTGLSLVAFRVGNVVSEAEVSGTTQARQQATTLAKLQYVHLGRVQRGFSLTKMTYPLLDTLLWGAGTVVLVALIASSPFFRRRRRARAERLRKEALARQLVLGGTVVMKHHR